MNTLINIFGSILVTVVVFVAVSSLQIGVYRIGYYLYLMTCGIVVIVSWYLIYIKFKDRHPIKSVHNISLSALTLIGVCLSVVLYYSVGGINGLLRDWIAIHAEKTLIQVILFNIAANMYLFLVALLCYEIRTGICVRKLILLIFVTIIMLVATRTKANLIPTVLGTVFIFLNNNRISTVKKSLGFMLGATFAYALYMLTTLVRWLGDLSEVTIDNIYAKWAVVKATTVERNMGYQSSEIFKYYMASDEFEGRSLINIIDPFLRLILGDQIGNPMYKYSEILNGVSGNLKGSVHPTIFIDGYANFGVLGAFQPVMVFAFIVLCSRFLVTKYKTLGLYYSVVFFGYAFSLAARGSVYYGILYVFIGYFFIIIFHFIITNVGGIRYRT